jgi:hypothetical protein
LQKRGCTALCFKNFSEKRNAAILAAVAVCFQPPQGVHVNSRLNGNETCGRQDAARASRQDGGATSFALIQKLLNITGFMVYNFFTRESRPSKFKGNYRLFFRSAKRLRGNPNAL